MGKSVTRLYSQFQPKHYDLDLIPDRETSTFKGSVTITGQKVGRPSQRLTLHQVGLKITSATIMGTGKKDEQEIVIDRINIHNKFDEVRLHAKQLIYPGNYTIQLEFSGVITRPMNGMYACSFQESGTKKQLLATQFESHHAREVFPCIDEPEAKATFQLTLTHPKGEVALSNTPIESFTAVKPDLHRTTFEITPKMSTYLLAFVYGEMGFKEAKTKAGVAVRTYATPNNVDFTDFSLEVAVKCLDFYNQYFGLDYPLPKADLIALPDFASGAMENWGCITFREQCMLVDPKNSTLATKQYVAMVVAHELAHQWFGNLVTMRWWTDLWLNEGFASWVEYLAVDHIFPEWQLWTQFAVDEQQQAMKLDALEHTHPIEVTVNHPDEIRTIFDAISYSKGASVIHMLHEYLGPKAFRDGLRHYLEQHKYGNTDTIDLWASLEEISGKPVKDFMHSWTSQAGLPLIKATVEEDSIKLEQERFFTNPAHSKVKAETWPVALLARHKGVGDILNTEHATFEITDTQDLKLNRGQSGFFRTAYNATHTERLGELVQRGKLAALDRLGILSDLFETAKAGHSDTLDALHFLENFKDETDFAVWDVIASSLGNLRHIMDDEVLREQMKPYVRNLVSHELERLRWDRKDNESHFDRLLRPTILGLASSADEPTIVKRCRELFDTIEHTEEVNPDLRVAASTKEVKRGIDIDPDLRGAVFGTVARLGDEKDFNKLLALHNTSSLSEERTTLAAALTGFRQPELIKRSLEVITSSDVRLQDVPYWIAYSFLNRYAKDQTWEWVKEHWDWLHENLGTDLSFFRMPIYVARVFSDKSFLKEYKTFFEPKLSPALERSYKQGIEMLEWQSAWKQRDLKEIRTYFSNQQDPQ
jgi:aminopeptidase N